MSIRRETPCDLDGICPYAAESYGSCEYWCGAEEPEDYPPELYDDPPEWFCVTFEDADDEHEYDDPPVYLCEGYPDD